MKNNKGITMISLVIVVLLMLLLASVTAYESNHLISITRVQSVTTDLLLIQAQVRIINEKVVFENDEEHREELLKGTKVSANENYDTRMALINKEILTNEDNLDDYYVLSQRDLNEMGLEALKASDGYVVNYQKEEVIFVKGVKNSEKKYLYKLQDTEFK